MTTSAFITLLEAHDWRFADHDKATKSQKRLLYLCQEQPELFRLYNHAENCIIRSLPFNFPSVVGTTPVKDETQHNTQNCNTLMKEYFQLFFDICIKPLVSSIDNLSIFLKENGNPSIGTVGEAKSTASKATEKPAKPVKAAKAAPVVTPEPEPEEATEAISEARLKATVKTLPDADKLKLKAYFQKKFSYNTMAEIAEEHRADIHAAAVKIGATDTDPDALGDM